MHVRPEYHSDQLRDGGIRGLVDCRSAFMHMSFPRLLEVMDKCHFRWVWHVVRELACYRSVKDST